MKVATIFGTRPEIIRLSLILKILDQHCDHLTIHTGQNFQSNLSDIFLSELDVRTPDIQLGIRSKSFGDQAGQIISAVDQVLSAKADKVLILGDTNSVFRRFRPQDEEYRYFTWRPEIVATMIGYRKR